MPFLSSVTSNSCRNGPVQFKEDVTFPLRCRVWGCGDEDTAVDEHRVRCPPSRLENKCSKKK